MHFYYNYSSDPIEFAYPHGSGKEQVTAKSVKNGEVLTIAAWDIIIIEEN